MSWADKAPEKDRSDREIDWAYLPSQLEAANQQQRPYRRLAEAVIWQAVQQATGASSCGETSRPVAQSRARAWISSRSEEVKSYRWWCQHLDWPESVVNGVRSFALEPEPSSGDFPKIHKRRILTAIFKHGAE